MRLYLIRHAETTHNAAGVVQGRADIPLSDAGREQSNRLRDFLSTHAIHAFYSSTLDRAHETAQIVAAPHQKEVTKDLRIIEMDFGALEGQAEQVFTDFKKARTLPYTEVQYPDGEHYRDAYIRARNFLEELKNNHANETIAVISHAAFIRVILSDLLGVLIEDLYTQIPRIPNTALSIFDISINGAVAIELIATKHLD